MVSVAWAVSVVLESPAVEVVLAVPESLAVLVALASLAVWVVQAVSAVLAASVALVVNGNTTRRIEAELRTATAALPTGLAATRAVIR